MRNSRSNKERINGGLEIYFERVTAIFPLLSPGHFWGICTKYGSFLKTIQIMKNQDSADQTNIFKDDFLRAINPYFVENGIRLGYHNQGVKIKLFD